MIIVIIGATVLLGGILLWNKQKRPVPQEAEAKNLSVVATFYPLEDFARHVGGETVTVESIVPAGAEPHEYEPTPQDILRAYQADVFLLNGAGMDPWAEKIRPELEKRGITVVEMSEKTELLPGEHEEEGHVGEEESLYDPHFWLDPVAAGKEAEAIHDAFVARDPEHQEVYTRNADAFLQTLRTLDTEYRESLADCRLRTVVTTHDAFAYLAKRYGFETLPISGLSPEAEPTPGRLAELTVTVRKEGIKYIFFETLVSPKVAETLARETGAQTLVFDPIEGLSDEDRTSGADYVSVMRGNLDNLKRALECR